MSGTSDRWWPIAACRLCGLGGGQTDVRRFIARRHFDGRQRLRLAPTWHQCSSTRKAVSGRICGPDCLSGPEKPSLIRVRDMPVELFADRAEGPAVGRVLSRERVVGAQPLPHLLHLLQGRARPRLRPEQVGQLIEIPQGPRRGRGQNLINRHVGRETAANGRSDPVESTGRDLTRDLGDLVIGGAILSLARGGCVPEALSNDAPASSGSTTRPPRRPARAASAAR